MTRLDRYLTAEVLAHWFAVLLILWSVLLVNRLVRYLGDAAAGELAGGLVLSLIGLKSVEYLVRIAPLALFLGILLAFGRLYRDHEMVALAACGVGPGRLYRPLLGLALLAAALLGGLALVVQPQTAALEDALYQRSARTVETEGLIPGRFQALRGGEVVLYTAAVDAESGEFRDLFADLSHQGRRVILSAARGRVEPREEGRYVVLFDGYRYQGRPGEPGFRVMRFARHELRLDEPLPASGPRPLDALGTRALLARGDGPAWAELIARLNTPLATLTLALLALPLAATPPRRGRFYNLLPGVLVFILYFNLLNMAEAWVQLGRLAPLPGLVGVHGLALLLTLGLLYRQARLARPRGGGV